MPEIPSVDLKRVRPYPRKVDVRLPGRGDLNSHGARPVHLIITMIQWTRTSRLSKKKSLSKALSSEDSRTFEKSEIGPGDRKVWPGASNLISKHS